ncbi:outer membrane protein TolC [Roseimicrobium gellanilyticum]|uniref:Outer membrane protein TolC n=2 Tax=Roseimicrobium gellanilyticum TaxID=748857 RepID=A0A366HPG8_9BACT|nr:outer membrane protein TolC [Roseimicrobium gellanilyticum]
MFGVEVHAEPAVEHMTLKQVVALALENNHDIAVQNLNKVIELERANIARATFDPKLEGAYAYQFIDTPQNAQDYVATGGGAATPEVIASQTGLSTPFLTEPSIFEQRNHVAKLAVVQKVPWGTTLELGSSLRVLDNTLNRNMPPGLFNPEYETFSGLTLTQPLLKDFGSTANLAELRIAKSNMRVADLEWRSRTAATVGNAMKLYYDVIFTYENMAVQRDSIELAQKLYSDNKKRSEQGVIQPNDVLAAEAAVYERKDGALLAETQYIERQNTLQVLFKKGTDAAKSLRIRPADRLKDSVEVSSREELLGKASAARYDILQAMEIVDQRRHQTLLAENQSRPRLDLIASAGVHGLAGGTGRSYDRALDGQGPEWTVGVTFSVPLGFKRNRSQARLAAHQETQAIIDVDRVKAQISLELDTVLSRIEMDRQRLVSARKSREVAFQTMEGEVKKLAEGVSTSYQVLQYQEEYSQTRSRELAALADLNKDQVDLWLVTGQMLEKQGIVVESDDKEARAVPSQK